MEMKTKIKVMQLGSPTGLYGAERWILALIRHLDPAKVESVVAAVRDEPNLEAPLCVEAEKMGIRTHVFECFGKVNLTAVRLVRKFILKNKMDIVHTHGYKTDLIALFATMGTACKTVSTPHGWTKQPDLKLRVYEIVNRMIFPFLDVVAPLSEEINRPLCRIPGLRGKLRFIRNGVDMDEILNTDGIVDEISELKRDGGFVIGYIGRLTPGKGLDILLKAVKEHADGNWRVAIVGDGEQSVELQQMAQSMGIADRVMFFGFRPDRLAFLKGFDVFVLPSRSEGIPRCLMEAMTAGVPVVASDIPGCRYLVDGTTTGLLFPPDNPRELAESIKKLSSDPALYQSLSIAGREFIHMRFSAARMADEYEELFADLCGEPV